MLPDDYQLQSELLRSTVREHCPLEDVKGGCDYVCGVRMSKVGGCVYVG